MDWGYVAGYFDGEGTAWVGKSKKTGSVQCALSWANSHKESLEAIQVFIGCGSIRSHGHRGRLPHHKPMFALVVERRVNMMRVAEAMLPHSIIKRGKLVELLARLSVQTDRTPYWGNLATAGTEEIRRLYWDEHLNLRQIGDQFGVSWTAVRHYMVRHDIPQRPRSETQRLANRDPKKWAARTEALKARRAADWKDPEYRSRMIAAIKAGQAKRIATLRANQDRYC